MTSEQLYYKEALTRVKAAQEFKLKGFLKDVMKIQAKNKRQKYRSKRYKIMRDLTGKAIKKINNIKINQSKLAESKMQAIQLLGLMRSDNVNQVTEWTQCKWNIYLFMVYLTALLNGKIECTTIRIYRYSFLVRLFLLWFEMTRAFDPNKKKQFQLEKKLLQNIQYQIIKQFPILWNEKTFYQKRVNINNKILQVLKKRQVYYENFDEVWKKQVPLEDMSGAITQIGYQPITVLRKFIQIQLQFVGYLKTVQQQIIMIPTIASQKGTGGTTVNTISIPQIIQKVLDKINTQTAYVQEWLFKTKTKNIKDNFQNRNINVDFATETWNSIMLITCMLRAGNVIQIDLIRQLYQPDQKLIPNLNNQIVPYFPRDTDISSEYHSSGITDPKTAQVPQWAKNDPILYRQLKKIQGTDFLSKIGIKDPNFQFTKTQIPIAAIVRDSIPRVPVNMVQQKQQDTNNKIVSLSINQIEAFHKGEIKSDQKTKLIGIQQQIKQGKTTQISKTVWSTKTWDNLQEKNWAFSSKSMKFCYKLYYLFVNAEVKLQQNILINNFILPDQFVTLQQQIKNFDEIQKQFGDVKEQYIQQFISAGDTKQLTNIFIQKTEILINAIENGVYDMKLWQQKHDKKLDQISFQIKQFAEKDIRKQIKQIIKEIQAERVENQQPNFDLIKRNIYNIASLDNIKQIEQAICLVNSALASKNIATDWGIRIMNNLGFNENRIENCLSQDPETALVQFQEKNPQRVTFIFNFWVAQMDIIFKDQGILNTLLMDFRKQTFERLDYIKNKVDQISEGVKILDQKGQRTLNQIMQMKKLLENKLSIAIHQQKLPLQQIVYMQGKVDTITTNWDGIREYIIKNSALSQKQLKNNLQQSLQYALNQYFDKNINVVLNRIRSYGKQNHKIEMEAIQNLANRLELKVETLYKGNIQDKQQLLKKMESGMITLRASLENLDQNSVKNMDLIKYTSQNIYALINTCHGYAMQNNSQTAKQLLKNITRVLNESAIEQIKQGSRQSKNIIGQMAKHANLIKMNNIQNLNIVRNSFAQAKNIQLQSTKGIVSHIDKAKLELYQDLAAQIYALKGQMKTKKQMENQLIQEKKKYIDLQKILRKTALIIGVQGQNVPERLRQKVHDFDAQSKFINNIKIAIGISGDESQILLKLNELKKYNENNYKSQLSLQHAIKQKEANIGQITKIKQQIVKIQHQNELQRKNVDIEKDKVRLQMRQIFENEKNLMKQKYNILQLEKQKLKLDYDNCIKQISQKTIKVALLQRNNDDLKSQISNKTYRYQSQTTTGAQSLKKEVDKQYYEIKTLQSQLERIKDQLNKTITKQAILQSQMALATKNHQEQIKKLSEEINGSKIELNNKKGQILRLQQKIKQTQTKSLQQQIKVKSLQQKLEFQKKNNNKRLDERQDEWIRKKRDQEREIQNLKDKINEYQKQSLLRQQKIKQLNKLNEMAAQHETEILKLKKKRADQERQWEEKQANNKKLLQKNQQLMKIEQKYNQLKNQVYRNQISEEQKKDIQKTRKQLKQLKEQNNKTIQQYEQQKKKLQKLKQTSSQQRKKHLTKLDEYSQKLLGQTAQLSNLKRKITKLTTDQEQKQKLLLQTQSKLEQITQQKKKIIAVGKQKQQKKQEQLNELNQEIQQKNKQIQKLMEQKSKSLKENKSVMVSVTKLENKIKEKQNQLKDMQNKIDDISLNPSRLQILKIIGNPPSQFQGDIQSWIIDQIKNKKSEIQRKSNELNSLKSLKEEKDILNERKIKQLEKKLQDLQNSRTQLQKTIQENQAKKKQLDKKSVSIGVQKVNLQELLGTKTKQLEQMRKIHDGFEKLNNQAKRKISQIQQKLKKQLNKSAEQQIMITELQNKIKEQNQLQKKLQQLDPSKHQKQIESLKLQIIKVKNFNQKLLKFQSLKRSTTQKLAEVIQNITHQMGILMQTRKLMFLQIPADGNVDEIKGLQMGRIQQQISKFQSLLSNAIRKHELQRQTVKANNVGKKNKKQPNNPNDQNPNGQKNPNDPNNPPPNNQSDNQPQNNERIQIPEEKQFREDMDSTRRQDQMQIIRINKNNKKIDPLNQTMLNIVDLMSQCQKKNLLQLQKNVQDIAPIPNTQPISLITPAIFVGSTPGIKKKDILSVSEQLQMLKQQYDKKNEENRNLKSDYDKEVEKNKRLLEEQKIMLMIIRQMFQILIKILQQVATDGKFCMQIAKQFTAVEKSIDDETDKQICQTVVKVMLGLQKGLKKIEQIIIHPLQNNSILKIQGDNLIQNFQKIKSQIIQKKHLLFKKN